MDTVRHETILKLGIMYKEILFTYDISGFLLHLLNSLPLLFKSLLPGQEDCVFFSGHLNLHAKPETGIPYREKNYNN
jgi:hypothetical protein